MMQRGRWKISLRSVNSFMWRLCFSSSLTCVDLEGFLWIGKKHMSDALCLLWLMGKKRRSAEWHGVSVSIQAFAH